MRDAVSVLVPYAEAEPISPVVNPSRAKDRVFRRSHFGLQVPTQGWRHYGWGRNARFIIVLAIKAANGRNVMMQGASSSR